MKDRFIKYCESIANSDDVVSVYEELVPIMDEAGLYQEKIGVLERIWHINQNHELLKDIGDIFAEKMNNFDNAISAYSLYLGKINPDFYKKFMKALNNKGYSEFTDDIDDESYSDLKKMVDRYVVITYMIVFMHRRKDCESVIALSNYLKTMKSKIDEYVEKNADYNEADLFDIKDNNDYLADLLVETGNCELCKFAIEINSENKIAYLNILNALFDSHKYSEALNYYNEVYAEKFKTVKLERIVDVCWKISDAYYDNNDFYKSILYQQKAIDFELENIEVNT